MIWEISSSNSSDGDSALPRHNRKLLRPYQYVLFFCLSLLLASCNRQSDELERASHSYKAHRDYASLEIIHGHLRKGMVRSKVEELLGKADYSPIEGQEYYSSDRWERAGNVKEQIRQRNMPVGLVVDYRDEQGELSGRLQSFWLGRIGE